MDVLEIQEGFHIENLELMLNLLTDYENPEQNSTYLIILHGVLKQFDKYYDDVRNENIYLRLMKETYKFLDFYETLDINNEVGIQFLRHFIVQKRKELYETCRIIVSKTSIHG